MFLPFEKYQIIDEKAVSEMMNKETHLRENKNASETFHSISLGEKEDSFLSESEKIELLSEEVQEIMGHVPPWVVRWGITVFFVILLGIIAGSFVFKYPDVITSTVVIISENPPVSLVARTNGRIDYLFVQNELQVKPGEILAILENTASYSHVTELKSKLKQLSAVLFTTETNPIVIDLSDQYELGPIQPSFSNFQKQYQEYLNYLALDLTQKKIYSIKQQLTDYFRYSERLQAQAYNQEKTVQLNYKQFRRDSSLFSGGVIAASELEKSEQTYLQVKNSYQSLMASLASTQMQVNQLNYQIIDLQSQKTDQVQRMHTALKEAYDNLIITVAEWEKAYVLISPIEGKVTFTNYWSKNQYVTEGSTVFTVVPNKPQRIIGRVKVPSTGSGKIKIGQTVHIRLENFPNAEFGSLEGVIESMSLIPESSKDGAFYTAEVSLPKGLTTNYQKTLPFKQEMQGTAEIITKKLTLFERLTNPFKAAIKKSI